jgi:rubrerythrin
VKQPHDLGMNRTGISAAPVQGPKAVESAREGTPHAPGDGQAIASQREHYVSASPPLGTVPPPLSVKGAAKTVLATLSGEKATVLVDQLAQRLAFERSGTRLYEAAIAKARALGCREPSPADLAEIATDERRHMEWVRDALERLGADPTVQTPSADAVGVASSGLFQVVTDPRTRMGETLDALLVAELADHASWTMLIELVRGLGYGEIATTFAAAEREEAKHVAKVRGWLSSMLRQEAGASA